MFKRIHWLSFIPIFIALLVVSSLIGGAITNAIVTGGATTDGVVVGSKSYEDFQILTFIVNVIALFLSFFIARGISRAIYDKVERRRYFKEHPEEDHHNK